MTNQSSYSAKAKKLQRELARQKKLSQSKVKHSPCQSIIKTIMPSFQSERYYSKKLKLDVDRVMFLDDNFYRHADKTLLDSGLSAEENFWQEGIKDCRRPNLFFNPSFYLYGNPELGLAGVNPIDHYFNHGFAEGRLVHESFHPPYYLEQKYPNEPASLARLMLDYYSGEIFNKTPVPHDVKPIDFRISKLFRTALLEFPFKKLPSTLQFTEGKKAKVSIIIPAYNQIQYTLNCLNSLALNPPSVAWEVIVIDDCSNDQTATLLPQIPGLKYIRNETNLGFLKSCNKAAAEASGEYLVLLNNDTCPLPGWIDSLLKTFQLYPNAGLVGAKLVYPDGRLQEAGGLIWRDGSGTNCGRFACPDHPNFNFVREVDYCSGAAIMIPQKIWDQVKGFDEQFAPAYYEDTDLSFSIRDAGYQVIYQPCAEVIHFEGVSSGTDTNLGVKAYQIINQKKFKIKWQNALLNHCVQIDHSRLFSNHSKPEILIIDQQTPTPDQDAGSVYSFNLIKILTEFFQVTFHSSQDVNYQNQYTQNLEEIGVRVIYGSWYRRDLIQDLPLNWSDFKLIVLQRHNVANQYLDHIKLLAPQAKTLLVTHDLHYYRLEQEAKIEKSKDKAYWAKLTKGNEFSAIIKSDATIVLGAHETEIIKSYLPKVDCYQLPFWEETKPLKKSFAERQNIFFLGGFNHPPNADALTYFLEEIWPLVSPKLPGVRFYVFGSKIPERFHKYANKSVVIAGYIESLDEAFDNFRVNVAPLRYGAGQNGKVVVSLCRCLPAVISPIAAKGIGLTDGLNTLIGADAKSFAEHLVSLYQNEEQWKGISKASEEFAKKHLSTENATQILKTILSDLGL